MVESKSVEVEVPGAVVNDPPKRDLPRMIAAEKALDKLAHLSVVTLPRRSSWLIGLTGVASTPSPNMCGKFKKVMSTRLGTRVRRRTRSIGLSSSEAIFDARGASSKTPLTGTGVAVV